MNNQVCFQSNHFAVFVLVGMAIIGYALWQVHLQSQQINELIKDQRESDEGKIKVKQHVQQQVQDLDNQRQLKIMATAQGLKNEQREQDYQRMTNPLIPPLQRDHYSPLFAQRIVPVNIPTRGEYDDFQQVGYAYKLGQTDQMFPVFGRRIHSNKYEYYVVHPATQIKIPIRTKNDWELTTEDKVVIKGFAGDFKVEIYGLDQPRYIPY